MKKLAMLSVFVMVAALALLFAGSSPALADVSGNTQSKIFHNASCRYYGCKACTRIFATAAEAIKAGYRACKKCGG
ncbi:MAG: Ada metal-binding domain-containing protein [Candidatus Adiutrix sp.]|jgi:hypothetical protein|nr:Ada metal-binding domain-containing protein [Candidatus Adiutrix sp.]